jgi:probable phosphoglycerate mutase
MQYTADATGIEPVIEDWLREWDRWYVDLPAGRIAVWDLPGELIRGREVLPTRDDWHGAAPLDDPAYRGQFEATAAASDAFLARHGYQREGGRYRQTAPNERRLAVFCHLGLGLAWIAHLLELPLSLVWSGFWLPASSVTTIVMECRSGDWAVPRCLGLGDVSHLHAAGLPVSPAGLHTGETCRP